MISKQGRFIFFHIPRTGGSAVQDCLWGGRTEEKAGHHPRDNPDYCGPYDWHLYGLNKEGEENTIPGYEPIESIVEHIGQSLYDWNTEYLSQGSQPISLGYGKEKFEEYFKFTFVRNPWDRFISLWFKFKEEIKLQEQFNGLFDLDIDTDFKEPQELLRYLLLAHRRGLLLPRWFKPQYEYVHDENLRILTNYVGMYEKFQFSFDFLCDRIDKPHRPLPWSDEDHRRKKKDGKHYAEWYDDLMINAIAEIYWQDIRTWSYEFGG